MLSILIPVYNHSVKKLVKELHDQCARAKIQFEILVFDDYSKEIYKKENQEIEHLLRVNYLQMSKNLGRSKIRNRLAKTAFFDNLLFLDSDSKVSSRKFIKNYIPYFNKKQAVCGGRVYKNKKPKSINKVLHWNYGTKRESIQAKKRQKNASAYFHTNNFLIDRETILAHPFDESVEGYGYEDLLFAHILGEHNIAIRHIDNPIVHGKLETNEAFISKHEKAVSNLAVLYKKDRKFPARLCQTYGKLNDLHIIPLLSKYLNSNKDKYKRLLVNGNGSLYQFDKYRLALFVKEMKT